MARTIVIGDIHGCYDELSLLLEKLKLGPDDRVVAVGDLTVKGPKSREVVELFANDARFSSVIGNHDLALLRHWRDRAVLLNEAQEETFAQLQAPDDRYFLYLASLPYFFRLRSHVVVHAGVRPGIALDRQNPDDLTKLRTLGPDRTSREGTPWYEVYEGPPTVLYGHWPAHQPRINAHAIGLDTGCVYGGQLTAYPIETGEMMSVSATRAYSA
jgi:hypothetical protein